MYTKDFFRACIETEIWENSNPEVKHGWIQTKLRVCGRGSLNAIYIIRKGQYYNCNHKFIGRIVSRILRNKLIERYGIFLDWDTKIGIGLQLPHPNGIIIGKTVEIGKNCRILQQVTIGSARKGDYLIGKQPSVGDNVLLSAGCKVLGEIALGNNTVVGANAVVLTDTVENGVYVGVPARLAKVQDPVE